MVITLREIGGRASISNATRSWTVRRGLCVELNIDGIIGVGECSPLPSVSAESVQDVRAELERLTSLESLDELRAQRLSSSAEFAIDTALLDRQARIKSTSIAALLCQGEPRDVRASVLLGDPRAQKSLHPQIRCAKLKVGPATAWTEQAGAIDVLVAINPDLLLRLDFNESLSATEAQTIVGDIATKGWPIDFVEDPSAAHDFPKVSLPLAIDTTALQRIGVERALELATAGRVQVAVLKPALLGGLRKSFELAKALTPDLDVVISHLLDGPIALAACAELACAVATLSTSIRAAGVGPHDALSAYDANGAFETPWLHPRVGGLMIER